MGHFSMAMLNNQRVYIYMILFVYNIMYNIIYIVYSYIYIMY